MVKKALLVLVKTMKWVFIVVCVFVLSLFFREQRLPASWANRMIAHWTPEGLVVHIDSMAFGFLHGFHVRGMKVYRRGSASVQSVASAESLSVFPFQRRVIVDGFSYPRLHDSYYSDGHRDRNRPVNVHLPEVESFSLVLHRPRVLSLAPESVVADVSIQGNRLAIERAHLAWKDANEPTVMDGDCLLDFAGQEVRGEVSGMAWQYDAQPFLEALELTSALEYVNALADLPRRVPLKIGWRVNLVNNDLDLDLGFDSDMGKFRDVPLKHVRGNALFRVQTRNDSLICRHKVGPVVMTGTEDERMEFTLSIDSLEGTNTLRCAARGTMALADVFKISELESSTIAPEVKGAVVADFTLRIPWNAAADGSEIDGEGHFEIHGAQIARLKGFTGLLNILADKIPGVAQVTDFTELTCDYTVEDGVFKSDNILVDGAAVVVRMAGTHDFVRNEQDFSADVLISKGDTVAGSTVNKIFMSLPNFLLGVKLTGPAEDPRWTIRASPSRVWNAIKGVWEWF